MPPNPYQNSAYWNQRCGSKMALSEVGWTSWPESYNRYRYQLSTEQLDALLQSEQAEPTHILELGCGIGFWAEYLLQKFPNSQYVGLDISQKAIANLQSRYGDSSRTRWLCDDVSTARLQGSYQLILALDLFLHITDDVAWLAAIQNASQHLAPGGLFIIADAIALYEQPTYSNQSHCKIRSFKSLEKVLHEHNLQMTKILPLTFFLDNNWDFAYRFSKASWGLFFKMLDRLLRTKSEWIGHLLGWPAYHFDRWFSSKETVGYGSKLIVCKTSQTRPCPDGGLFFHQS